MSRLIADILLVSSAKLANLIGKLYYGARAQRDEPTTNLFGEQIVGKL